MLHKYSKESNDKFFQNLLYERFKNIDNSNILEEDYKNFTISVKNIPDKLKNDIIKKYDNLTCTSQEFIKRFGRLTFKEAFIKNYFMNCKTPRCCFCGQILEIDINNKTSEEYIIADIEHIFPKSIYPQLALHPKNFAPCCKECNEVIKKESFFKKDEYNNFKTAISDLGLDFEKLHPLCLCKNLKICDDNLNFHLCTTSLAKEFLNFYHIEQRIKILYQRAYSTLFNIIRHSDICSPESLERLLENIASSSWHEINHGYSLNNSLHIWQVFVENILYDECKLMALWDEIKSSELRFL